jgi:hypothetical protein
MYIYFREGVLYTLFVCVIYIIVVCERVLYTS